MKQLQKLKTHLEANIIGQKQLVERMLMAILANGHLLVEGAPGLAKTKAIKLLADCIEGDFKRIQFTPDLLPADIVGSEIYRQETGEFEFKHGQIFNNFILADEINRAPAKVQSALLEAMAERQVSVGHKTFSLDELFLVMATQNPIEQEGTYNLPEAQLDRFLMHIKVDYPEAEAERQILNLVRGEQLGNQLKPPQIKQAEIFDLRKKLLNIKMLENVEEYLVQIVLATRKPELYSTELADYLQFGGSPRATIALDATARAKAMLEGRDYVIPEDIQSCVFDCLRHRIVLSFEAETAGETPDSIIEKLLQLVPVN